MFWPLCAFMGSSAPHLLPILGHLEHQVFSFVPLLFFLFCESCQRYIFRHNFQVLCSVGSQEPKQESPGTALFSFRNILVSTRACLYNVNEIWTETLIQ